MEMVKFSQGLGKTPTAETCCNHSLQSVDIALIQRICFELKAAFHLDFQHEGPTFATDHFPLSEAEIETTAIPKNSDR